MLKQICLFFIVFFLIMGEVFAIESLDGFLVSAYDDRFKVISPEKFKANMEVIVENKTLVRLIGKLVLNNKDSVNFIAVDSEQYKTVNVKLKKSDVLHFVPLTPAFQEVELIVGNKIYEIPPKK
ncbi:MAG: hypothetical protein HOP07_02165 [Bacteriovoracaceae bacterium]|nr:hypothetical protein [Bacteriovoracaceae bacterium]